jgi:hypothetical protein
MDHSDKLDQERNHQMQSGSKLMHFTLLRGGENAIKRSLPATKLCFADCLKVLNILACEGCRWVLLVNLATPQNVSTITIYIKTPNLLLMDFPPNYGVHFHASSFLK